MNDTPFFTVLLPCYNIEQHVYQTIASVLAQTFQDFELLIIDDGSTDHTAKVIESFGDNRIRFLKQLNQGVSRTRNRGIREAVGKYVAFLDGDDVWNEAYLEYAYTFFKHTQDISWYASPFLRVNEISSVQLRAVSLQKPDYSLINYFDKGAQQAWCSSTIIKREELLKIMNEEVFFPEDMTHGEDLAAWVKFAIFHPLLGSYNTPLVYVLNRGDSALGVLRNNDYMDLQMTRGLSKYFSKYMKEYPCTDDAKKFMRSTIIVRWIIQITRVQNNRLFLKTSFSSFAYASKIALFFLSTYKNISYLNTALFIKLLKLLHKIYQ